MMTQGGEWNHFRATREQPPAGSACGRHFGPAAPVDRTVRLPGPMRMTGAGADRPGIRMPSCAGYAAGALPANPRGVPLGGPMPILLPTPPARSSMSAVFTPRPAVSAKARRRSNLPGLPVTGGGWSSAAAAGIISAGSLFQQRTAFSALSSTGLSIPPGGCIDIPFPAFLFLTSIEKPGLIEKNHSIIESYLGWPVSRSEIIPAEPDLGNASVGNGPSRPCQ